MPTAKILSWAQRNMPTREQMERNRFIRRSRTACCAPSCGASPAARCRAGVARPAGRDHRAVAQILFAALLSVPVRANVPLAALATFVTNPFTTPLIWVAAYWVGGWLLRIDAATVVARSTRRSSIPTREVPRMADPGRHGHAFGLVVIAVVSAGISYCIRA
jgi:uncharacterized protein (DUF2062 family)